MGLKLNAMIARLPVSKLRLSAALGKQTFLFEWGGIQCEKC